MSSSNRCKIHKYKRVRLPRNAHAVYKCVVCPHYVVEFQVIGRESICWYCGNTFTMSHKSLLLKPHCGCRSRDEGNLKNTKKWSQKSPAVPDSDRAKLIDYLLAKSLGVREE